MPKKDKTFNLFLKFSLLLGLFMIIASGIILTAWFYMNKKFVSTNEARFSSHKVTVSTRIDGKIEWLEVREGDFVKENQTIVVLDRKELEEKLAKSKMNCVNAEKNLNLMKKLNERGVISSKQVETAQENYDLAQAQYRIDLTEISNTVIQSPISGIVVTKSVSQGEVVKIGVPIVTIADFKNIWLIAYVDEVDIPKVRIGQKAYVKVDAYPKQKFEGIVESVSTVSDAERAFNSNLTYQEKYPRFSVRIKVNSRGFIFRLGMSASVKINVENK